MTIALAAPQYSLLRGSGYACNQLVKLFSNRVVFAGQINSDLTTPTSWAQFNYNNVTVGAYTDVRLNQVLVIGHTNSLADSANANRFYGRIRLTPTGSIIYCNESSVDFAVGDYFWVIDNHTPQYRLNHASTTDPATALQQIDFDQSYHADAPEILGLQTGYGGKVLAGAKLRVGFDVSASYPVQYGDTIASYQYYFPSGSVIAGATNTAIVVMDFLEGESWGECTVTGANGQSITRYFGIQVISDSSNVADSGFEGGTITRQIETGDTFTIPAFADVDSVLLNTTAIVFRTDEVINGTSQSLYGGSSATITNKALTSNVTTLTAANSFAVGQVVIVSIGDSIFDGTYTITAATSTTFSYAKTHANVGSAGASGQAVVNAQNVDFVGWLTREDDPIQSDVNFSVISTARFTFTGIGPRMAMKVGQLVPIQEAASPSVWGDILHLTSWRGMLFFLRNYTTITNLADLTFDDTTDTYRFPILSTQGGNMQAVIKGLADQIESVISFSPTGGIEIKQDIAYATATTRNARSHIADWQSQDGENITRSIDPQRNTGLLDADGAVYSPTTGSITEFTVRSPGNAQDEGATKGSHANKILTASDSAATGLTDLRQRAGDRLEVENNNEFLDVDHLDSYTFMYPSRYEIFTWTLSSIGGSHGVNRVIYDSNTLWTIDNVTLVYDSITGGLAPKTRYRKVPSVGDLGDDTTQVAQGAIVDSIPDLGFPAFDLQDLLWPDIGLTPDQVNPAQLLPPPGKIATFKGDELVRVSSGNVYYNYNFVALKTPKSRLITPSDLGSYVPKMVAVDPFFTNTAIPCYLLASDGTNSAVWYTSNVAAPSPIWTKGADVAGVYTVIRTTLTSGSVLIYEPATPIGTTVNMTYVDGSGSATVTTGIPFTLSSGTVNSHPGGNYAQLNFHGDLCTTLTLTALSGYAFTGVGDTGDSADIDCSNSQINSVVVDLSGTLPNSVASVHGKIINNPTIFTATFVYTSPPGSTYVRLSTDRGATFASALTIGSSVGTVGGFDMQRAGTVSYAGCVAKVRKATTLGGAYSDWYSPASGDPVCCIIPYYRRNSTTKNTNVSDPDVIVATTTGKLYWVDGTAATATDITPTGMTAFDNANCITVSYGHHIAVFGKVSGTYHLFTSTNGGTSSTDRGALTSPMFIRDRRNDTSAVTSATNKGQVYLAQNGVIEYSSTWASNGVNYPRTLIETTISFDTIW